MRSIILIAHNLRSSHNVGSLIRTAEGLGIDKLYLTGYSPYPRIARDKRLPHLASRVHAQIAKTALGAESMLNIEHHEDIEGLLLKLRNDGYEIYALEQTPQATALPKFKPPGKIALIVGREVEGLEPKVLRAAKKAIQIPMLGKKESYNVSVAAGIALYHIRFN